MAKIKFDSIHLAGWPGNFSAHPCAEWAYYPNELEPVEEKMNIDFDEGLFYQMIGVK